MIVEPKMSLTMVNESRQIFSCMEKIQNKVVPIFSMVDEKL